VRRLDTHPRPAQGHALQHLHPRGTAPTPVALPGREAVLAAVRPEPTDALYFVATGLGDGAHHFSSTLQEHNSAVKAYLARLRTPERGAVHKPVAVHP